MKEVLTAFLLQEKTIMTQLSIMLISGQVSDGGSVRIGVDTSAQNLTYTVQTGVNGPSKRGKSTTTPGLDAYGFMNNQDEDEDMDDE